VCSSPSLEFRQRANRHTLLREGRLVTEEAIGVSPADLFVFAGAGASRSTPAGLPTFAEIRYAALSAVGLKAYIETSATGPDLRSIIDGVAPERFLQALLDAGADPERWLRNILAKGRPNAVHDALAQLATHGARIWTVNFDELIEATGANGVVPCVWPDPPDPAANLFKPHGTLSRKMIFAVEDVLKPLDAQWEEALRADVRGRTAVFIGYRGRDMDFQPLWADVLSEAASVVWFQRFEGPDGHEEQNRLLSLIAGVPGGRTPAFPEIQQRAGGKLNPSWDFVNWCQEQHLTTVSSASLAALDIPPAPIQWPILGGNVAGAKAKILEVLGEINRAKRQYAQLVVLGPSRRQATNSLARLTLNHGGWPVSGFLAVASATPAVGPLRNIGMYALRKRLNILVNRGKHREVVRLSESSDLDASSLVSRASSLRYLGSLDLAAETALTGLERAKDAAKPNAVVMAHARFQLGMALMWAGRIDEARACIPALREDAMLAANRWVGWTDFLDGALLVHEQQTESARELFKRAEIRFESEPLLDGVIACRISALAAARMLRLKRFEEEVEEVLRIQRRRGTYYTQGHRFPNDSLALERSEYARVHKGDLDEALRWLSSVEDSPYPLHRAIVHLGKAAIAHQLKQPLTEAERCLSLAREIDARMIAERSEAILRGEDPGELFFP
jgi:tetratricopeptide (TPR) repeat protein